MAVSKSPWQPNSATLACFGSAKVLSTPKGYSTIRSETANVVLEVPELKDHRYALYSAHNAARFGIAARARGRGSLITPFAFARFDLIISNPVDLYTEAPRESPF